MVTLDLFHKKTRLYYIGLITTLITILSIAALAYFDPKVNSFWNTLYEILLIICIFTSLTFILLSGTGVLKIYVKDGELVLTDDYLLIDNAKIIIAEAKSISFKVSQRSVKSRISVRNNVEIFDNNGNYYQRRFVIKSYDQNQDFEKVLDAWVAKKIKFGLIYRNI